MNLKISLPTQTSRSTLKYHCLALVYELAYCSQLTVGTIMKLIVQQ